MENVQRKLGNYIIAAFIVNVFAIMSIGGICILMVKDMVHNINKLEAESENVAKADDINNTIHNMIFSIHHAIIETDKYHLIYAIDIVEDVADEIAIYKAHEEYGDEQHNKEEVVILTEIQENLTGLKNELDGIYQQFTEEGFIEKTDLRKLERFGNSVQNLTGEINKIHFAIIANKVQDSYEKMYFILFLYIVSSVVGIMASVVGYLVLTRNTVVPIKRLAKATRKVAAGDLSVRVDTRSVTEIGSLYESFNVMTEKLEEHEKRREEFKKELEKQVLERTKELRAANESLKKAQADLIRMEKIATLGQIATTVNHEIKTPLNSLYMNLQLLAKKIRKYEGCVDEEAYANMLSTASIIDREIVRISGILEEFVKYARFAPPDLHKGDINNLLQNITGLVAQSAKEAQVEIKLSVADAIGSVMLDEKKMTQALLNLCVNAIHAMPDGGTLTLESRATDDKVFVRVADTGGGIAPEDLENIFNPFFTKKEGGLGFGLAIVQRIIEDHKGRITCQSRVGEYTEFLIELPAGEFDTENE